MQNNDNMETQHFLRCNDGTVTATNTPGAESALSNQSSDLEEMQHLDKGKM